jgi:predicted dehydrogenase
MSQGEPRSPAPASIAVAIVGAGVIGTNHASAILRHPRLRVAAVIDPDESARRALAARVGQQGGPPAEYATLSAALAAAGDVDIDLVAVCTPSGLHADLAQVALAADRHVFIEKPLDVSLPKARRLARLAGPAEQRGLVVSVVSQHRFDPASVAVAGAVAAGRFGRITSGVGSVAWWRGQDYYDSAAWRGTWALDGGGAVMNQGVHTVDLLVWLLGPPTEVSAYTGRLAHERIEVEDVAVATVRFASGALGVLHATTAAYPETAVRLGVYGDRGTAVIYDDQLEYFHVAAEDGSDGSPRRANQAARVVPADQVGGAARPADRFVTGHLRQYDDVVEAIDGGRPASVRVDDGLTALAVVRAIYLSATLGRPIAVDEVRNGAFDDVPVATGALPERR